MRLRLLFIVLLPCLFQLSDTKSILAKRTLFSSSLTFSELIRGGSIQLSNAEEEENDSVTKEDPKVLQSRQGLLKYRMDQQELLQMRSTFLSEELAKRGLPMTTLLQVSTPEGEKTPEIVDWDCAMSTVEEPKTCLYSFDAEPNTKVIAPIDSNQWISLSALNRLRRTDPTKVEPMWHSQYSISKAWFGDSSEYCILQHCDAKGIFLSFLLDQGVVLKALLAFTFLFGAIIFLPLIEFTLSRFLVSSAVWSSWHNWARVVHAALPLKLLLGQIGWKGLAKTLGKLEQRVRDTLIELECVNLEERIPLTVGPGSDFAQEVEVDNLSHENVFEGFVADDKTVEYDDNSYDFDE
mmetsp:Transcript_10826/g.15949  ORF Transcript_10826/g.15949 Transcript_10826/m.15949 type:complete len:351 (-) Transcript_10826:1281-2333(-)